jgi:lysozyme family protein
VSEAGFLRCLNGATWRPENDGQPYHVTPGDAGGATAWGVTFATFAAWRRLNGYPWPVLRDLETAPVSELQEVIHAVAWCPVKGDALPVGVDLLAFEAAVMSGAGRAARVLQGCVGAAQDGVLGPVSMGLIAAADPVQLVDAFAQAYRAFVDGLGSAPRFAGGWDRRIAEDAALAAGWLAQA